MFTPIISSASTATGATTTHGCGRQADAVLADAQPPVGGRRLDPEPKEAEARDEQDRRRNPDAGVDEEGREDARGHFAEHDVADVVPHALRRPRRSPSRPRPSPLRGRCG